MTETALAPRSVGVIGRDAGLRAAVGDAAAPFAARVEQFATLAEIGFIGRLGTYDLLVIETNAAAERTEEVIEVVSGLVAHLPVVIVADGGMTPRLAGRLPACVRRVINRSSGPHALLQIVRELLGGAVWRGR